MSTITPTGESRRPTQLVRIGVVLVLCLGAVLVALVAAFGLAGLAELVPGPAPSIDAAAFHIAVSPPRFVLSVAFVGGFGIVVAAAVMWVSGREFTADLRFVDAGIEAMVYDDTLVASIPLRTLDELGSLVRSFEVLRRDFGDALERERELRREVERADAIKGEFLRAVSHELRTPLNSILGFADVLLEELDGPLTPEQREDLEIVRAAGRHLLALFTDVIDLSEAVTDRLRLERVRLAVRPIVSEVAKEVRGLERNRQIEVRVEVPEETPHVDADPKRLRQILTNLASNAIKFTSEGTVKFTSSFDDEQVTICVTDTGLGIPEDELENIFLEFGQVVERGRHDGAGLGLAIAKRLAELHGGSLEVESTVGEGSTFTLRLPRWTE